MKKHINYYLLYLVLILLGFSLLFFACLSVVSSLKEYGNPYHYFFRQLFFNFVPALILGIAAFKFPLNLLKKWSFWLVLVNIGVLFLVFTPLGLKAGGASRWINIGFINFQPSEFLKITAIIYLSAWIASKLSEDKVKGWKSTIKKNYHNFLYIFIPFIIFLAVIFVAMYLQRDASTLGVILITLLVLYFFARTPWWHTVLIIIAGLSGLFFMIRFTPYRLDRWFIFLNPDADPLGKGFQLSQSLISLGSGGVFGKGLGMSTQKFGYLPEAMTDSIFAIMGEELGIIGGIIIIAAFILLFWIGIQISKKSNDRFGKAVSIGVVFWICFQAFINISSTTGIFPITGIPLPFFSYGGSHLAAELIGIGLLLNISKNT